MKAHLPQLDGLRGIAILIVLVGHLLAFSFGFGIVKLGPLPPAGVDLFFVLSGFLITGILLRTKSEPGYFKNFYARRGLRIWPLYYLFLSFMFLIAGRHILPLSFDVEGLHWQVFALYLQNVFYHQASQLGPLSMAITWSLAVEEQFYLIWPAVVFLLSPRKLVLFLGAIILAAPVFRAVIPRFGFDPYINPLCRFDAIAMGSLLALWLRYKKPSSALIVQVGSFILGGAVLGEVAFHLAHLTHIASRSMVSAGFTALLALSLAASPFKRALSIRPLVFIGKVSYCVYLTHVLVAKLILFTLPGNQRPIALVRCILIVAATYALASVSWICLEKPILGLKRYFENAEGATQSEVELTAGFAGDQMSAETV